MHDHQCRAGRARALQRVSRVCPQVRRGASIPERADTEKGRADDEQSGSTSGVAANGGSNGADAGTPLPDSHVRVGLIEASLPKAPTDDELAHGLADKERELLVDLFALISEHADDAIQPVDKGRVG